MEFDKSRIYSAINADELKAGDKVIVADSIADLKEFVKDEGDVVELEDVYGENFKLRFKANHTVFLLAYLVERKENCTNCIYEGSAGCSVVEICGENKLTHRCHMYEAKDTKRNLCDSCKHFFAECSATSDDIIFGDGVGNDNVYDCAKYESKSEIIDWMHDDITWCRRTKCPNKECFRNQVNRRLKAGLISVADMYKEGKCPKEAVIEV